MDVFIPQQIALCEAATAGPWFFDSYSKVWSLANKPEDSAEWEPLAQVEVLSGDTATLEGLNNAAFMAAHDPGVVAALWRVAQAAIARRQDGSDGARREVDVKIDALRAVIADRAGRRGD